LCRVVKKSGFNEDVKAKGAGACSSSKEFTSNEVSYDPLSVSSDNQGNASNYSTPISSPCVMQGADIETSSSIGFNSSGMWVSPEFILDSSKVK